MMSTWRVFSDDHVLGELVTAEKIFINEGNGLIFSVAAVVPEEPPPPLPMHVTRLFSGLKSAGICEAPVAVI